MITDSHLDELKAIFIKQGVTLAYPFSSHAEARGHRGAVAARPNAAESKQE
jgi:hypothetical protein